MAFSDLSPGSTSWRRAIRRRWTVPLSIALHAAVLYTIGRVPWAASEIPQPAAPTSQVVWLEDVRPPKPLERALDPTEPSASVADNRPAEAPPPEHTAAVAPPPPQPSPVEPAPIEPSPERPARPAPAREPAPRAEEPVASTTDAPPAATIPDVDWDKERHDAVRDVIRQRATEREYLTFSYDDVFKEPEPEEPVLPPLVVDQCVIVKGRLQRFAALMTGRCVREARSDLFAAIKPAYLRAHPVCVETRPDNPGSFLSDGRQISTVKCELVAEEGAE
jgi:hypothetical protein